MNRNIMLRHGLNAEAVFSLYLHSVNADILLAEIVRIFKIAGNDARFIQIVAAVPWLILNSGRMSKD